MSDETVIYVTEELDTVLSELIETVVIEVSEQGPPGPTSGAALEPIYEMLGGDTHIIDATAGGTITVSAANSKHSVFGVIDAPAATTIQFTPSTETPNFITVINASDNDVEIAYTTGEGALSQSFVDSNNIANIVLAPGYFFFSQRFATTSAATQYNYTRPLTSHGGYMIAAGAQVAADAKVENNLTASTTVAPSKTAVNTALDLKQDVSQPAVTVSMASADMTASVATAAAAVLNLTNTGDGTKTLTITAAATLRGSRTIRNSGTSAVHVTSGETYSVSIPAGESYDLIYVYGTGFLYRNKFRNIASNFAAGTTNSVGGTVLTEQIVAQVTLPYNSLQADGDSVVIQSMMDKSSGGASIFTVRMRLGTAGTTSDTEVWAVNALNSANDGMFTEIVFTRINATTLMISTMPNWYVPFNISSATYTTFTVPNLNTTNSIISMSADYSSGGSNLDTVSNRRLNVSVR